MALFCVKIDMCTDCEARRRLVRDALFKAKMGEAAGHALKGAVEAVGLKPKTGSQELAQKRRRAKQVKAVSDGSS